ncbi:MAG TPA: M20/M25/M40 family metallo-hydrolase [Anaerolineaceae bacterium]
MPTWYPQVQDLTLRLVRAFSQTDTPSETAFAHHLYDLLAAWPIFRERPGDLRLEHTQDDPHERSVLFALVRGTGPQTLILTGHYDVVPVENYGALADAACDPAALLPRLVAQLAAEAARGGEVPPADRLALADLRGGGFLPGRGMLDMKSGLAAGLAVMQRFIAQSPAERCGNLLFIAVPDEEIASHGMRTGAARLPALAAEWGLELAGAINLDASDDHGDGHLGQAAYLGSIGKLLPAVYLVGRETHAGSPFQGLSAALLAADLTRRIECAPDLADSLEGEFTPPPVCLKLADTKIGYDVTTPTAAWCYFNWLTLRQPAQAVLETVRALARQALDEAVTAQAAAAARFAALTGRAEPAPGWQPRVYSYREVLALAKERGGEPFETSLKALETDLRADPALDAPTCSLRIMQAAWAASGLTGLAAVVGFAALYYPPTFSEARGARGARFRQVILRQTQALSAEASTPISVRPFFPGISDISFLGGQVSADELEVLAANSPAWRARTGFDFTLSAGLNLPTANIGPWGRDYHQRIERVYTPYSFEVLPELLWRIQADLLGEPKGQEPE